MAVNLWNLWLQSLNPLSNLWSQTSSNIWETGQWPVAPQSDVSNSIQNKINQHTNALQNSNPSPSFDFSKTLAPLSTIGKQPTPKNIPAPTGGWMLPPTPEAKPLQANPIETTPTPDNSLIPKANAWESIDDKTLNELTSDVKNWATIDQINNAYPEFNWNKDIIGQLSHDIWSGATIEQIKWAYPELFWTQTTTETKPQDNQEPWFLETLWQEYLSPITTLWWELTKGINNLIDKAQGNQIAPENQFHPEDVAKIGNAAIWATFNAIAPFASLALNTVNAIPWLKNITQWLGYIVQKWWQLVNNLPWLSDFRNSLWTEQDKQAFDSFVWSLWLISGWETAWKIKWMTTSEIIDTYNKLPQTIWWKAIQWVKNTWQAIWEIPWNIKGSFSQENVPAITPKWTEFNIDQTPWISQNIKDKLFWSNDLKELATKAVNPKITKEKTLQGKLNAWDTALKWIIQLYDDAAKWVVTSDIKTMAWWVEWVQQWLDYYGSKIWDLTSNNMATIKTKDLVSNLKQSLNAPHAWISGSMYNLVNNIVKDFESTGKAETIKTMQDALSNIKWEIYWNAENIGKLYKTNVWRALNDFLNKAQERFDSAVNETVWANPELQQAKSAYSSYKKIQKDLTDSFLVDARNQSRKGGLSATAWKIAWAYELLSNPSVSWILKAVVLKKVWEELSLSKSRSWNYEKLMRNLDRESVQNFKTNPNANDWNNSISNPNMDNSKLWKLKWLNSFKIK